MEARSLANLVRMAETLGIKRVRLAACANPSMQANPGESGRWRGHTTGLYRLRLKSDEAIRGETASFDRMSSGLGL